MRDEPIAVGVARGDGTLSTAAKLLAPAGVPLVALPLGTRNHFARDLGVPLDLEEAAQALAEGCIRAIDAGEVNGRLFLNNASVGLYTRAVRWHESLLAENRLAGKRLATLYVLALMARRLPATACFSNTMTKIQKLLACRSCSSATTAMQNAPWSWYPGSAWMPDGCTWLIRSEPTSGLSFAW